MNKTFDLYRLSMVIRWDVLTNWKDYFKRIAILGILFALISVFQLHSFSKLLQCGSQFVEGYNMTDFFQDKVCVFFIITCSAIFFIFASCIFYNMKTKLQRENFLMLPASLQEKYVARLLITSIGGIVMMIISLVFADFIQLIFSLFMTPGYHGSLTWATFLLIFDNHNNADLAYTITFHESIERSVLIWSFIIFSHSFCVLGGTFYRKNPALLTACTCFVLLLIFGYIGSRLSNLGLYYTIPTGLWQDAAYVTFIVIFLALAAFDYWASYKIFARMQVICNKWINL